MSKLVLLVEPGSAGAERAIDRVRTVLAGSASVALVAAGHHTAAVAAVGAFEPTSPAVILTTSGSTGNPRAVELPAETMLASAERAHERLGGSGIWLTAIPVTGAGGLNTVVRSLLVGSAPVVWPGIGGAGHFDGETILPALQETHARARNLGVRTYTSLVPTQLSRLASHAHAGDEAAVAALRELARFDAVLVGADALDSGLRSTLHAYEIPIVTTYGATETCGGCVYEGTPLRDVDVSFTSEPPAQIVISGPTVARQYLDGDSSMLSHGRWVSQDLGDMSDGVLTVLGRVDDVIKLGGVTVALPLIADALRNVDGISDVVLLARPDAEWGRIPVAYIVGSAVSDTTVRQLAATAVGRTSIPMDIVHLDTLPLLANGKVDRQALMEQ